MVYICDTAERSRDGLDTRNDDQHNKRRSHSSWQGIFVSARLYSACHSLCCFPRHLSCVLLPCLQAPPSCLRGIYKVITLELIQEVDFSEVSRCNASLFQDRALAGPWIFFQIFKACKVVENRHGPWKSLNLCLKVLESAWIWFSKMPWLNQLILKKVFQMASFWPQMCIKSIFGRGFAPHPAGELIRLCMLIKVPVCCNLVLLIYSSYGPWKSLNLILTHGQEPCQDSYRESEIKKCCQIYHKMLQSSLA